MMTAEKETVDLQGNIKSNDNLNGCQIPTHPIPVMQGAFAESFMESDSGISVSMTYQSKSAQERRRELLEQDVQEDTHAAQWKLKPGQEYHELLKLMAQISFGIYLLLNGIARNEEQVMKILQVHVDEVDGFLEKTLEDFGLAQQDIQDRLNKLKSHLINISAFDVMMEDRNYRLQIVEGNEKTEHIIKRTVSAMNDALRDVQQGASACKYFSNYLSKEQDNMMWRDKIDMQRVYQAMKGNVDGWYKAFISLQVKGNQLDEALIQLRSIVEELDRRAGEVSRKTRFSSANPPTLPALITNSPLMIESRLSRQVRQSLCKSPSPGTVPRISTLRSPVTKLTPEFGVIHELEPSVVKEPEIPETELLLMPHTYTPLPSPSTCSPNTFSKPLSPTKTELNPSSLSPSILSSSEADRKFWPRKHFSVSRRGSDKFKEECHDKKYGEMHQPVKTQLSISIIESQAPAKNVQTSPSRDLDSAYCSDFEKTSPQRFAPITSFSSQQEPTRTASSNISDYQTSSTSCKNLDSTIRTNSLQTSVRENVKLREPGTRSLLTPMAVKIPEHQYFRPVNASPHSPLQRPWTASPTQNPLHTHANSSSSNLSNYSASSRRNGDAKSNMKNSSCPYRNVPSAMGKSMMSYSEEKRLKKKRSMFGWLKEQFSLSEEERIRFEEKIKNGNVQRSAPRRKDKDSEFHDRRGPDRKRVERGKVAETRDKRK